MMENPTTNVNAEGALNEDAPIRTPLSMIKPSSVVVEETQKHINFTSERQDKFSEFLKTEKQRKFKRLPKVIGQRKPVYMKCPSCGKERTSRTRVELTGMQVCTCVVCCWTAGWLTCCVPFCIKRCYNVKHSCQNCYFTVGESGI